MKEKKESSILKRWKVKQKSESDEAMSKAPQNVPLPLSHGQERLWMLQQLHPGNPFYNYSEAYVFKGNLNIDCLFRALQIIYDNHDILRTTYKLKNGVPFADVGAKDKLNISEFNVGSEISFEDEERIQQMFLADSIRPFDLENGPVIRCSLYKFSDDLHILLLNLHHIATDKWSMTIFRQQLAQNYVALAKGENPDVKVPQIQYQDYAYWQRKKTIDADQMDYWREKLSGELPVLTLPKDFPPPLQPTFKGAFNSQIFSSELSKAILRLSNELETTPFILLLSVYYLLLFRYTGQKDILIGSPISNRDQKYLEGLIGFFNDTVVLRTELNPGMTFKELVGSVKKTTLEAFANKDVPFEDLVKTLKPERSLNSTPFFNVMFLYHAVPPSPDFDSGLEISQAPFDTKVAKFDLTLYISEKNESLSAIFEYATDIFENETIERLQGHLQLLLEGAVENPDRRIAQIPMLLDEEKEVFSKEESTDIELNASIKGIHDLISEVAIKHPDKKAVAFGEDSITYGRLEQRANMVAQSILGLINEQSTIIGLATERSIDMIVGVLGILKAGCAYLPIDLEYPYQRIHFMLDDAKVGLILCDEKGVSIVEEYGVTTINIDKLPLSSIHDNCELPKVDLEDLAYLIYTSGSTGRPKGVPISHKNILNSTLGRFKFYNDDPEAFLLLSSIAFDSSKAGIFWTLCTGGTLVISEKRIEQDIEKLVATIQRHKVSHTLLLPSLYELLLDYGNEEHLQSLAVVIVAGEACPTSVCIKHFNALGNVALFNEYGPTEATVWCVAHQIKRDDLKGPIPIGKAVANAGVHILDDNYVVLPYGAVGELCVSGLGLTKGYLNLPDDTVEQFREVVLEAHSSAKTRIYRTGDLARYGRDGNIEFLGRKDQQVKIRGYRIELAEIEKVILANSFVDRAVVMVESDLEELEPLNMENMKTAELLQKLENRMDLKDMEEILRTVENLSEKEQEFLIHKLQ